MMTIAISGIGGFLGSYLMHFFSDRNVVGISTSQAHIGNSRIFRFEALDQVPDPEIVIHCHAAVASGTVVLDHDTLYNGNVHATEQLADQFPNAKHIYISTVAVYGNNQEAITESTPPDPQTEYAKSKWQAEQIILKLHKSVIIRLSSLFGNGMKENTLIPNYTNQALRDNQIEVWGTGERKQNYIHVNDVATLIQAIIGKDLYEQQIFLGTAAFECANIEIAQIIASETGAEIVHRNEDHALSVQYNNTFTQKTLNWLSQTNTAEAIKAYIQWKKRPY